MGQVAAALARPAQRVGHDIDGQQRTTTPGQPLGQDTDGATDLERLWVMLARQRGERGVIFGVLVRARLEAPRIRTFAVDPGEVAGRLGSAVHVPSHCGRWGRAS